MTVRRLHVSSLGPVGADVTLSFAAARHVHVLRLRVGDPVVLFDGAGNEADATISAIDDPTAVCRITTTRSVPVGLPIVLVQCLPKAAKLDSIVRMTTEIGVAEIRLAVASRSIARPEEEKAAARTDRLRRIAEEAARQCERADVPRIDPPAALLAICAHAPVDAHRIVLTPRMEISLDDALANRSAPIWIVVGPEGGISGEELHALAASGWKAASLPTHVLRVETAGPVAVAIARSAQGV